MNTHLRKIKKNSKALSPVIASIILIAVTVAVSVVVAAWMGGMSMSLIGNAEQLSVTNVQFVSPDTAILSVRNSGGEDASIVAVFVNSAPSAGTTTPQKISKDTTGPITVSVPAWTAATSYNFKLTTAKGNNVVYSVVSP